MQRTELEIIVRNPETGEHRTFYGNGYKPIKCNREGFTEVVSQKNVTFKMKAETFRQHAERVEE